jgi:hypothetical protein
MPSALPAAIAEKVNTEKGTRDPKAAAEERKAQKLRAVRPAIY